MQKKSPTLAGLLGFIFGPFGFLYIGWRYAVLALLVFLIFGTVLTMIDFPIPAWMKYVILLVSAWKGYTICAVRNQLIDSEDENIGLLNSFPFAAMAMSDLLVGIAIFFAAAIGLYAAGVMFFDGNVIKASLMLVIGTPVLVWAASLLFGFIAMGLDALFAKGAANVFR
jgi:hypothetical protein